MTCKSEISKEIIEYIKPSKLATNFQKKGIGPY